MVSLALVATAHAQSSEITALIRLAQERSSLVKAAQSIVDARRASLSGARINPGPSLEVAPGVGYTNGNSVLSQEFDLFGRRRASSKLAQANLKLAQIEVMRAQQDVSQEFLVNVAKLHSANGEVEGARLSLESAKALQVAVAKQHEIGEAPRVHVTRAEVDVLRATQHLTIAEGRLRSTKLALQSLLGQEIPLTSLAWPEIEEIGTIARSFDLMRAAQQVGIVEALVDMSRSAFAPTFTAGLATDIWSLDRNAFKRDNVGLQLSLRMPLFDSGQRRAALNASRNEVVSAQAVVSEAQRFADLKLAEATSAFETAKTVAASYEGDVLPKGESMLTAMREGYASGLVTLVEVLEAQQTLAKLRQDHIQAVLNLRLAEVELWKAQLILPGTEVPR